MGIRKAVHEWRRTHREPGPVQNWSGSVSFEPATMISARSEADVVKAVRRAADRGKTLRPIGSAHSSTPLFATPDVLLSVDDLSGLDEYRREQGQAVLRPGTGLEKLGDELLEAGGAMKNLGDVSYQTIAGALSTGTHGTGVTLGNLSSTLVGGRLVTASGEVVPFGSEADDDDDDLLRAARVSLGTLGVFSSVTLAVDPAYDLHRRNWMTHIDWVMEHWEQLVAEHRHVDFYWYPRSDRAQVRIMDVPGEEDGIEPTGAELKTDETGPAHRVLTNDRDLRFDEMEYMLPRADGMAMFREVRERIKLRHRHQVGWRVLVRTIAPDDTMLSNCNGRDTMTIALLQNDSLPYEEYFDDMEPVLRGFGGRPHWGKKHSLRAAELAELYPEWDRFQSIRRRLDPDGVFMNDYLTEFLDTEGAAA